MFSSSSSQFALYLIQIYHVSYRVLSNFPHSLWQATVSCLIPKNSFLKQLCTLMSIEVYFLGTIFSGGKRQCSS